MKITRKTTTNRIFDIYAKKLAKLTVRMLDRETVLVEGSPTALEFVGNVFLAMAKSEEHSVQFSPNGAGKHRFSKRSTTGIYIHKLPCTQCKN